MQPAGESEQVDLQTVPGRAPTKISLRKKKEKLNKNVLEVTEKASVTACHYLPLLVTLCGDENPGSQYTKRREK